MSIKKKDLKNQINLVNNYLIENSYNSKNYFENSFTKEDSENKLKNINKFISEQNIDVNNYEELPYILILIEHRHLHELNNKSYLIFYFPIASYSFISSIHNATSITYVGKVFEYYNSDNFSVNSILKIDTNRFVITIPYEYYQNISLETLKNLKETLRLGYFTENYISGKMVKKQLFDLINSLSGINNNIILGYDNYFKEIQNNDLINS